MENTKKQNCVEKDDELISLGEVSSNNVDKQNHIPSKIQADTLFTFCTELDHIIPSIREKMISPRYCEENISYLKIRGVAKIAYPMKCFCDINLHRLEEHLQWYGYYGLAFSKEWGMRNHIQPVQYINPDSNLCKDFTTAFSAALELDTDNESPAQIKMKNFLLHEMMYFKPYEGEIRNRNTRILEKKCFTDECEWRFIPDLTAEEYAQAYYNEKILNAGILSDISNSMFGNPRISLSFDYSDLKYIIVKANDDFNILAEEIASLGLSTIEERQLLSKVIVWDVSKGDF